MFAVATETDHVAPWRSVYKLHLLTDTRLTFVLTSGGHNAGVVSEPGHPNRHYRVATRMPEGRYVDPDVWIAQANAKEGSWWPEWLEWLSSHSGAVTPPPRMGAPQSGYPIVCAAPGTFVGMT